MTPRERVKSLQAQLRRLKHDRSRFVALCAGSAGRGSVVYALDGHGQVWRFAYQTETWVEVGMTRVGKGQLPPQAAAQPEAASEGTC